MAEMRPSYWDQAVFWVNCDEAVLACLEPFDFTTQRREQIKEDEAKHVESLTSEHVSHILISNLLIDTDFQRENSMDI